jgi:hypothetical protein
LSATWSPSSGTVTCCRRRIYFEPPPLPRGEISAFVVELMKNTTRATKRAESVKKKGWKGKSSEKGKKCQKSGQSHREKNFCGGGELFSDSKDLHAHLHENLDLWFFWRCLIYLNLGVPIFVRVEMT